MRIHKGSSENDGHNSSHACTMLQALVTAATVCCASKLSEHFGLLTVKLERQLLSALPGSAKDGSLSVYLAQLLAFSSPCCTQSTCLQISSTQPGCQSCRKQCKGRHTW